MNTGPTPPPTGRTDTPLDVELEAFPVFERRLMQVFREAEQREHGAQHGGDTVIGDFRIVRLIGEGGMARVYEAEQVSLGRRVALKLLPAHLSLSQRAVTRFHREARAGGRQHHPGIVSVFAMGEADGVHYIAQELVGNGRTLADRLEDLRAAADLPRGYLREVVACLADVSDALAHAHASGVVHRDVKPSNILLAEGGRPMLTDFGLALVKGALGKGNQGKSDSGSLVGTPYYVSPEQASGNSHAVDDRADVFSLGVTLYECLTLERPFEGDTTDAVLRDIRLREPRDPRRINARIPRDLAVICLKALEKDPVRRYPSMAELSEDLRRLQAGEAILARPAGRLRRMGKWVRRHQLLTLTAVATATALVSLGILGSNVARQQQERRVMARQRYAPLNVGMVWTGRSNYGPPWRWCVDADPGDPAGPMLRALDEIKQGQLPAAVDSLAACLTRCAERDQTLLASDAHHLLGFLKLKLAADPRSEPERRTLLAEARHELLASGPADPLSREMLVWRDVEPATEPTQVEQLELRIDTEHGLAHLYQALAIFDDLYKAGRPHLFEQSIAHFEQVLADSPDSAIALTFLGRVSFFYARSYMRPDLLPQAEELLQRALLAMPERQYYLTHITLGQIDLALGNTDAALEHLHTAAAVSDGSGSATHNITTSLGNAYLATGNIEAADALLTQALAEYPDDVYTRIALAELHLTRGDTATALAHATEARTRSALLYTTSRETHVAAAYLIAARIHLERGDPGAARTLLDELYDVAIYCPADLGRAVLLIATFPPELLSPRGPEDPAYLVGLARNLAHYAASEAQVRGAVSPICLSAQGTAELLAGQHESAVASLDAAMHARRTSWPEAAEPLRRREDARDLFLRSIAQRALDPDAATWQRTRARAEQGWQMLDPLPSKTSIEARIRARAHSDDY